MLICKQLTLLLLASVLLLVGTAHAAFPLPGAEGPDVLPSPGRSVSIDWDVQVPLTAGDFFNITLGGFQDYRLVMVFLHDVDVENNFFKYDVSGRLGHLHAQAPNFPAGSIVRVYAVGIPSYGEAHQAGQYDWAESDQRYVFADVATEFDDTSKAVNYAMRNALHQRTATSVYIYGDPLYVRIGQMINVFWTGFAPDTQIEVQLVCPSGKQIIGCVPAYQEYVAFMVGQFPTYPQTGCYVQAAPGTVDPDTFVCTVDYSRKVRSVRNYLLRGPA